MAWKPRLRSAGETNPGVECCVATLPDGRRKLSVSPCDKCAAHFGRTPRAASFRTAVPHDYSPPDVYGLDAQRARDAKPAAVPHKYDPPDVYGLDARSTEIIYDAHGVPDPYATARAREKENR